MGRFQKSSVYLCKQAKVGHNKKPSRGAITSSRSLFATNIWVDAICIDQSNLEERKQQVQLMAKIYSKAHRVIVWLGREAVNAEGVLEDIRLAANEESTEHSKDMNQPAILKLLERQWFQRIWVRE
jgi:hypothetical protein